ncbi:MAG: hypothetical protein JRI23_23020 [Deltaproteobacteria bacterium]|jgi:hypothetical protein|nr:hypothetical protein [Deltaproteobacteria bacterium]MBW2534844.1 hypothetical protein [Deltaproteobacteria bacterium]
MAEPIAVCIEDLNAPDPDDRFMRCVAIPGAAPGLGLAGDGVLQWETSKPSGCQLCVSLDDRLVLLRPIDAEPVRVRRAGRSLDVPFGKPVVLLDQDEIEVGGRRLRLHVHGQATSVHAPTPFRARARSAAAALAAAVALGGAATGCDEAQKKSDDIEVRDQPPTVGPPEAADASTQEAGTAATATTTATSSASAPTSAASTTTTRSAGPPPIEVRSKPPLVAPAPDEPVK